jgi:hypothetical protein
VRTVLSLTDQQLYKLLLTYYPILPGVSGKVVDGDLTVLPFEQVLEYDVGQVKVQGVRVVEVVVLGVVMIFLGETLVEGVQGDVRAVQTYTFYDTRKESVREITIEVLDMMYFSKDICRDLFCQRQYHL